ncbi:MAG: hypothetical protein JPMHGGIA_01130 [Saprospiraceae bacterium]|jgi:hypothetical protein|nr:hypothetical protein [Saprospiraceae bacterium]
MQIGVLTSEAICFSTSLVFHKSLTREGMRLLPAILGAIFISDSLGILLTQYVFTRDQLGFNLPYYNIVTTLVIVLYGLLYLRNLKPSLCRMVFGFAMGLFVAFFIVNVLWIQPLFSTLHTFSFTMGSLSLCLGAGCYLRQLVQSERVISMHTDPFFWISIGLFAFYIINAPYMAMYNYLLATSIDMLIALRNVNMVLNYFMYLCIFLGLQCANRK